MDHTSRGHISGHNEIGRGSAVLPTIRLDESHVGRMSVMRERMLFPFGTNKT